MVCIHLPVIHSTKPREIRLYTRCVDALWITTIYRCLFTSETLYMGMAI
ncbi:Hypothetical protein ETEE_2185 [Edwardsiella anguillarum ET080813]|uniref:Uncharacterized protein n=1 Tax=Edwardsiella anguillarum ET080813 TaxID=667120 RepID=A0A076LSQ5_9GAMM|nr:Hypothetical protein ETEE_2185 [Edwardsiella anguillarum ET080813]